MAHIGVQSSFFFFKICSQWLWMCHQCNHEQDWTGFISLFQQGVSVWFFWYPRHVTGMSAKQSQWASFSWTEYGTQTLPPPPDIIFGRGQVLSALNGPLGNLEQLCRRKCFFGGFEMSWWMLPFSAKLQQAFHGLAGWSVWNLLCPLMPSGDCPYCACSGVKETLHSHLVSWVSHRYHHWR